MRLMRMFPESIRRGREFQPKAIKRLTQYYFSCSEFIDMMQIRNECCPLSFHEKYSIYPHTLTIKSPHRLGDTRCIDATNCTSKFVA